MIEICEWEFAVRCFEIFNQRLLHGSGIVQRDFPAHPLVFRVGQLPDISSTVVPYRFPLAESNVLLQATPEGRLSRSRFADVQDEGILHPFAP